MVKQLVSLIRFTCKETVQCKETGYEEEDVEMFCNVLLY